MFLNKEASMQRIGTKVTITVPEETLKDIEKIAERFQMSKAEVSRNMLELGLDTYKIYSKTGLVKIAEIVRKHRLKRESSNKD